MNIHIKFRSNWPGGFREDEKRITPFLTLLGLLILFCAPNQQQKHKFSRGPYNEYSYQVWFQLAHWF